MTAAQTIDRTRPAHRKQHYRDLSPESFAYGGFWDGLHHWQQETRSGPCNLPQYALMSLPEEHCTREVIAEYARLGITYDWRKDATLTAAERRAFKAACL